MRIPTEARRLSLLVAAAEPRLGSETDLVPQERTSNSGGSLLGRGRTNPLRKKRQHLRVSQEAPRKSRRRHDTRGCHRGRRPLGVQESGGGGIGRSRAGIGARRRCRRSGRSVPESSRERARRARGPIGAGASLFRAGRPLRGAGAVRAGEDARRRRTCARETAWATSTIGWGDSRSRSASGRRPSRSTPIRESSTSSRKPFGRTTRTSNSTRSRALTFSFDTTGR